MNPSLRRWLIPGAALAVVALAAAVPTLASAGNNPALPPLSAGDLLAATSQAQVAGLSGTVAVSSDLGLPALGQLMGGSAGNGPASLASGQHVLRVWSAGTDRQRVTIDGELSEYGLVRRGTDLWTYDSATDAVTHRTLDSATKPPPPAGAPQATPDGRDPLGSSIPGLTTAKTPQEAAAAVLAAIDPSTAVTVDNTLRVAGRDAYSLALVPRDAASLVGRVSLAVDAETKVPLRVQVLARGASTPAVDVGFTDVSFAVPPDNVFATPTGRAVPAPTAPKDHPSPPTTAPAAPTDVRVLGSSWTSVVAARGVKLPDTAAPLVAQASTPVTVAGVSGRLARTTLVSALLLDDGRAFVGAVTPETLTALAAANP